MQGEGPISAEEREEFRYCIPSPWGAALSVSPSFPSREDQWMGLCSSRGPLESSIGVRGVMMRVWRGANESGMWRPRCSWGGPWQCKPGLDLATSG